jgi:hypothetical protein
VLQSGPNPSTDYYIRPRAVAGGVPTMYRDVEHDRPSAEDLQDGTLVIVVRYLNRPWAEALHACAARLAGVVYFMDDDLLDPTAWVGLPRSYHDKLARHFATAASELAALTSQLWVSTAELAARYAAMEPTVMPPLPLVDDVPRAEHEDGLLHGDTGFVRMFYHGTRAHEAEIRWLRPVVAACLEACPQAHMEIIGDQEVNRLYRGLPRTRVLHPMSWPNYVAHCRTMRGHIGLVPLLEGSFNAGRSYTKVFDVARCGAVGVYSRGGPYDAVLLPGSNGELLMTDKVEWTKRIIELITDRSMRSGLQRNPAERLASDATVAASLKW